MPILWISPGLTKDNTLKRQEFVVPGSVPTPSIDTVGLITENIFRKTMINAFVEEQFTLLRRASERVRPQEMQLPGRAIRSEPIEKLVDRFSGLQIVKERLYRDSSPYEYDCPTHDVIRS